MKLRRHGKAKRECPKRIPKKRAGASDRRARDCDCALRKEAGTCDTEDERQDLHVNGNSRIFNCGFERGFGGSVTAKQLPPVFCAFDSWPHTDQVCQTLIALRTRFTYVGDSGVVLRYPICHSLTVAHKLR